MPQGHDQWGNRLSVADTIANSQLQGVTLQQSGGAPTNRISSITTPAGNLAYTYDAAGNVLSDGSGNAYHYDAENRLVAVSGAVTAQYGYNAAGKRVKKVSGGATTHYIWQGGSVIAEHNGGTGARLVDYVSGGGRFLAEITTSGTAYLIRDWLSERLILDANGNVLGSQAVLAFGETGPVSGAPEKHYFTSYERDPETGLDYANHRVYSSVTGRFQSVDPYKTSSVPSNPQMLNRYGYVAGDPVNSFDPSGLYQLISNSPAEVPNDCVPSGATDDSDLVRYDCLDDPGDPSGNSDGGGGTASPCTISFNVDQSIKGSYPNDNGTPPLTNTAGPDDYHGGSYFFFEAIVTPNDGSDPSQWSGSQTLAASGKIKASDGSEVPLPPSGPDGPLTQETDKSAGTWLDSPGFDFASPGPGGKWPSAVSGSMTFSFTDTATGPGGATCFGKMILTLKVEKGKLVWSHQVLGSLGLP